MTMIISCKRLLAPYADLLEPLQKRSRLDVRMVGSDDDHQDSVASSSSFACGIDGRRRQHLEDFQEYAPEQPAEKRLRLGGGFLGPPAEGGGTAELGANGAGDREVAIRGWAEATVRSLQNCPSTEEASQRCVRILSDFEAEVQQVALREGDVTEAASESALQSLQHTKKVLMRAVHHLAQRCRQLEANSAEADELKDALEKSQGTQRRLAHANEMLKEHLRLYVDGRM